MDVILASVTPSVANNSLPPPPRANRRKSNFPKGSSVVKSEKQQSLAHREPKLSLDARLPHLSDSSRQPSVPAIDYNGPFPAGGSRDDGMFDRKLQLINIPPMLVRGHSAQARMERPTQPTPSEDYLNTLYPSPNKLTYSNVPFASSRSSPGHSNEWGSNLFNARPAFLDRQHNNSSTSPVLTGRNSPDPKPPPMLAPTSQLFISPPEPQGHPAKANKILGIGGSNLVPPRSRYIEHQPPRRSYEADVRGVQRAHNSKANKLLGLDERTPFVPSPRSHSSSSSGRTATPPRHGAPDLGRVHSNSGSRARVGSASSTQEIEDLGRWRRESFMDFSPSFPSHQKSKSQPETLSRPPNSASSFQTIFSVISTDSGIPAFPKRRPESIGKSQPNTTLKVFKDLITKTDRKVKDGRAEDEWEKLDAKEADFDPWGWGVPSSVQERRQSEWAEAQTLPDEDREERVTPEQTTPKQTSLDLSMAQSAPVNALDQKERLAVIRKKRKITQLLGTDIPPDALGPTVQDGSSVASKASWEPLNNQRTVYLDPQGNMREEARFSDLSDSFGFEPSDTEQSSFTSSILTTNDGVNEFGTGKDMNMKSPNSPTSFMELSDEELDPHKGKAKGDEYFPLPQQSSETSIVRPPTQTKAPIEPSSPRSCRTFSTFATADLSLSPPGSKALKHKPSFITEILEDSDWEAHERKKKRDKLAKMHRFLGSRVPAELVLGCSSGTIPPAGLLLEEDDAGAGQGQGKGWRHNPSVGWNSEREMRSLGTMGGSEKMVQIRRAHKIEKMFGEQPPSTLLRPSAILQTPPPQLSLSSPPSRSVYASSGHSLGVPCPASSYGPTPFTTNVTHQINLLYKDLPSGSSDKKYKSKHKEKFVPSLPPISTGNGANSARSSIATSSGSMINNFKEQERGWKGKAGLATPPKDVVFDISPPGGLSVPLHKGSYSSGRQPLLKEHHSAPFVHYRNSFKSLAMIIDLGDKASLEELYAMLNSISPAGSDTEAELAHTKHIHEVSGYESDPASPTSSLSRRRSHPSRMSMISMSSISSGSSLFTLTPEPMGFQARRKRAAKLTNFFGASYRDLFGEVLEKLETGFLEEAKEGGMSREEIADLMGHVKTLKRRQTEIW